MIMSKCYRASANQLAAGQMRCISCHDPHVEPTADEAPAFFNGKCMSCHTERSCTAPTATRQATAPADNCIGCHMPQHENPALAHSSITNHRIVTRSDEPYPDAVFEQTTAALPDLVYLNGRLNGRLNGSRNHVPGRDSNESSPPPGVALLEAYDQLHEQWPEYSAAWLRTLNALEKSDPDKALVQASLGHRDLEDGKLEEAAAHLRRSLELDPAQFAVYVDLSAIAGHKGQVDEAVAFARKAVTLDPFNAATRKVLVLRLINAKRYAEALPAMEQYLHDFPEDDLMRKMLAIAKEP
jgi:Flp pilus assembly protein TadD